MTVVDAVNLLRDYSSTDFLRDRGEVAGEEDERALVDLLVEQIEFADVVVLNKVSAATPAQREAARQIIVSLNPDADIIETDMGVVPLARVLNTHRFDYEKAHQHPLWYKELFGFAEHVPETEEYGIRSFVYRACRPFLPDRFKEFIDRTWPGVVRSKGHFWLATRPEWVGELGQAGALVRTQAIGFWWCEIPRSQWPDSDEWRDHLFSKWDPVYADRRQEMVFIGTSEMDEEGIRAALDRCLAPEFPGGRFDPLLYARLPDPFPEWRSATEEVLEDA